MYRLVGIVELGGCGPWRVTVEYSVDETREKPRGPGPRVRKQPSKTRHVEHDRERHGFGENNMACHGMAWQVRLMRQHVHVAGDKSVYAYQGTGQPA